MKKLIFLFLLISSSLFSQTIVPQGYVSGEWIKGNSPYLVNGDILVHKDSVLSIEQGVRVEFQGHYKLSINGQLLAKGAEGDSIVFTVSDTTGFSLDSVSDGGWGGLRFEGSNSMDSSRLEYCIVEYGKQIYPDTTGGGINVKDYEKLSISNSTIAYNKIYGKKNDEYNISGGGIYIFKSDVVIKNNIIQNNLIKGYYENFYWNGINKYHFKNTGYGGGVSINNSNIKFEKNEVKNNLIKAKRVFGAGISCNLTKGIIYDNLFHVNICLSESREYDETDHLVQSAGGAIYSINSDIEINNNEINENSCLSTGYENRNLICCGGGIASDDSDIKIKNNIIIKNKVIGPIDEGGGDSGGGGIYIMDNNNNKKNIVFGNEIKNNYSQSGDGYMPGKAYGGGLFVSSNNIIIENNNIEGNYTKAGKSINDKYSGDIFGGGIYMDSYGIIKNNFIKNNTCQGGYWWGYAYGGGIFINKSSYITNNYIANNEVFGGNEEEERFNNSKGGGLYNSGKSIIINNTFYNNNVDIWDISFQDGWYYESNKLNGKNIYNVDSTTILKNNLIWNNIKSLVKSVNTGEVSYCNINDTIFAGIGNISQEPFLDSLSEYPYTLKQVSPCINAGTPDTTGLMLPANDLAGNPRVVNGRVDIGAYEYNGPLKVNEQLTINNEQFLEIQPNPVVERASIIYRIDKPEYVRVSLYDYTGRDVRIIDEGFKNRGEYRIDFNVNGLRAGMYYVKLGEKSGKMLITNY